MWCNYLLGDCQIFPIKINVYHLPHIIFIISNNSSTTIILEYYSYF